jgi:UDP-glucuronate 4-epimerase
VTVLDNLHPFYPPELKRRNLDEVRKSGRFEMVEGDIRDRTLLKRALHPAPDVVLHLAAMAGVRPSIADPGQYVSVNVDGTCALLDAAVAAGVTRFVFAGSSSVYGNNEKVPFHEDDPVDRPISPYAATKRAGELLGWTYHHLHGISFCSLRFFTVYGPRQRPEMAIRRFTELIDAGRPVPFFGDGSTRRDYTYVDDITTGVLGAVDRHQGFGIYNLGESRTTTLARLVSLIEEALEKRAVLDRQPLPPGDVRETFADITRARTLLGYAPRIPVEDGIKRFVAWYRRADR